MMKKDGKKKKLYITGLCVLLAVAAVMSISLAFLSNSDSVTNRQEGRELRIELLEPSWWSSGQEQAAKLEPGMTISKDPYVQNLSKDSVYVRMKLTLKDADGNAIEEERDADGNLIENRYTGILKALRLSEGSEESIYDLIYGSVTIGFFYDADDGWFYYGTKTTNETEITYTYTELEAGKTTSKLFAELQVPVLRSEYEGVFDTPFTIEVEAQGIGAATEQEKIRNTFAVQYAQ
jgi:flagellar basal body-associated protein FliL